jgi:hypothetical protein
MEHVMTSQGEMLVHARNEWPCLICRPSKRTERGEAFLCVNCCHDILTSSVNEGPSEASNPQDAGFALAELIAQAQELESLAVN